MLRHVFLTGPKQIGKSTLLRKVLARYPGRVEGFRTIKTKEYLIDQYSVHLCPMGETFFPDKNNLLFVCGKTDAGTIARFNRLGHTLRSQSNGASLLVMDELGPNETHATAFHNAILTLLNGSVPVFGVLQAPAASYWPDIVQHPAVQIIEVTASNRDDAQLFEEILSILKK